MASDSMKHDIVQFVQEVEKFPCIYNVTMPEYSNRTETKRAWSQIAMSFSCTETECKERWRKIRIAFSRSLKQQYMNQTNKQYYLYDYLTFLLPYIKINDEPVDHNRSSPVSSEEERLEIVYPDDKIEIDVDSDDSMVKNEKSHSIYINERSPVVSNSYSMRKSSESYKMKLPEAKKRKVESTNIENNPRKMFLLSLLPDIESFSDDEMRAFRRGVICTIDNVIEKRRLE